MSFRVSAIVLLFSLFGCATNNRVEALEFRIAAIERADQTRRQSVEEARRQMEQLNEQLTTAQRQLRVIADLGVRLDGFDEQLRGLRGSADEMRRAIETVGTDAAAQRTQLTERLTALDRRITELERRAGIAPAVDPNQIPASNPEALTQARAAATARDFNRARAIANAILSRAPQDPTADDARLVIARSFTEENRPATAIQEYRRLIQDFPNGDAVPDALAEMSEALIRVGFCTEATRTLQLLTQRYGSTPQGTAARRRIEEVRRLPRASCSQ